MQNLALVLHKSPSKIISGIIQTDCKKCGFGTLAPYCFYFNEHITLCQKIWFFSSYSGCLTWPHGSWARNHIMHILSMRVDFSMDSYCFAGLIPRWMLPPALKEIIGQIDWYWVSLSVWRQSISLTCYFFLCGKVNDNDISTSDDNIDDYNRYEETYYRLISFFFLFSLCFVLFCFPYQKQMNAVQDIDTIVSVLYGPWKTGNYPH